MTTSQRRITLLAGASISALGLSSPALADPWYPRPAPSDTVADGVYPGFSTAAETIVICDLDFDDSPPAATDPCFFGEKQTGAGNQAAAQGDIINQTVIAPTGPVTMTNNEPAEVAAIAISTAGDANAYLTDAIDQFVFGAADDDVTATIDNNDLLLIRALAVATDTVAVAQARNVDAIDQFAIAGGDVTLNLINDGTMHIGATAVAFGETSAIAIAANKSGIEQSAYATDGGTAANNIVNNGELHIGAYANASATDGRAFAIAAQNLGIQQNANATGGGDAVNTITNNDELLIQASATATGMYATAYAVNKSGIEQNAYATGGGDAVNVIANAAAGVIEVTANANASATEGNANALAAVGGVGIEQNAYATGGGVALNQITNAGTVNILANAVAIAPGQIAPQSGTALLSPVANAQAFVQTGIRQDANAVAATKTGATFGPDGYTYAGTAVASSTMVNTGTLNIGADAFADGAIANSRAGVGTGISQGADANGGEEATATVSLTNGAAGAINVFADASAQATFTANAYATVGTGIEQLAYATAIEGAAVASADLDNLGAITVGARANAVAGGTDFEGDDVAGAARAEAGVEAGIIQSAAADGGEFIGTGEYGTALFDEVDVATASVTLNNAGTIGIAATASASGGFADADATVGRGIDQFADADGDAGVATASLTNAGTITIAANASAFGDYATADASVETGIRQQAYGVDQGLAAIANTGTIAITADANAAGDEPGFANVDAEVDNGIIQYATATAVDGVATATLVNGADGQILISANAAGAYASGGAADAEADVGTAIDQFAYASMEANAILNNAGAITVTAIASATADDDADADANIDRVIDQDAVTYGEGGVANATLTNTGTINAAATATAIGGGEVDVDADVDNGIDQTANAGEDGTAAVVFNNTAPLTIQANAVGVGGQGGSADANAEGGDQTATGGAGASATMTNTSDILVAANASIIGGNVAQKGADAEADAEADGWSQTAVARTFAETDVITFDAEFPAGAYVSEIMTGVGFERVETFTNTASGPAVVSMQNSGTFAVTANATAISDDFADADADVDGINQFASGNPAYATIVNDGTMTFAAMAYASGDNGAAAEARVDAIDQTAVAVDYATEVVTAGEGIVHLGEYGTELVAMYETTDRVTTRTTAPTGVAVASLENNGLIYVTAVATAIAGGNDGPVDGTTAAASALATASGIEQNVAGATASAIVDNDGAIAVAATAVASGAAAATAEAEAQGITQRAGSVRTVETETEHYELVTPEPDEFGHEGEPYLTFVADGVTFEETNVGAASVTLLNTGTVDVTAIASAVAGSTAVASAVAGGAFQSAAGATANAYASNAGTMNVTAAAVASGTNASAVASAYGIGQVVAGDTGGATVNNSGALNVAAGALATGTTVFAAAYATGVWQEVDGVPATFNNSGTVNVTAVASAAGTTGTAVATAVGLNVLGVGGGELEVDIVNSGTMTVAASAIAPGTALALARGIMVVNEPTVVAGPPEVVNANPISGTIVNSGTLNVVAFASGGEVGDPAAPGSAATATGIHVMGGAANLVITNSGELNVDAVTANGGPATAYGIRVASNGAFTPAATDLLTINNSGDIIVRISDDGGTDYDRGMAISVAENATPAVINLLGGNIFGNIDIKAGDDINVTTGETVFNGIINPECMPAGGPTALGLDVAAQNTCGQGDLTINNGGNLHLVIDGDEGPSYAFVDTFTVGATGTIEFDLPAATGGTAVIGTYPQIFTEVANLDGTLVANIPGTLFETTVYENVIDALVRNGTFDQCIINGIPGNSLLLEFGCVYDGQANVDLRLERTAFNDVPGLNDNGTSVGEGLECIYDVNLTGGIADLLSDLFLITDEADYNEALNQLAGASYANYMQSFSSLGVHYNDLLDHATSCEVPALAGSVIECRASAPVHLWGQLDYQTRKADGDVEAGGYRSKRWTALIGADVSVGNAAILGVSVGKVSNKLDERRFGDDIDADGFQVGAYGVFDPGSFYVKAMSTLSWFDGDSRRNINFVPFGGTFAGTTRGDPDVKLWTLGLHGGARMAMGGNSVLTPFLNLDHVNARMKDFIEEGLPGADLHLDTNRMKRTFLTGGVKWATQMGGVVPEAKLAYRHRFGDTRARNEQAFLCQTDTECEFDIVSASEKRGAILAGLSIGGKLGPVDLRLGYEGEFNRDIRSHAGNFRIILPLGGRAPAPAPVVAPPPPPPPPVIEQAPPPPPPPPPPPVERGERGQ